MSTLLSLPSCLHRTTAFVILALAIFMIAAHTGITAIVAQRTSLSPKAKTIGPFVVAAFLASWLAIAILVGDGTNFPIPSGVAARNQRISCIDSVGHCSNRTIHVEESSGNQYSDAECLADRHSNLPRRWHNVHLSLCYAWNLAGRFWLPCWHWRRINWDLRAHRGLDGRAKPA